MTEFHFSKGPFPPRISQHATSPFARYSVEVSVSDSPKQGTVYSAELFTDDPDHDDVGDSCGCLYNDESLLRLKASFEFEFVERDNHLQDVIDEAFDMLIDDMAYHALKEVGPRTVKWQ